jgi:Uncharacterized conserved protein
MKECHVPFKSADILIPKNNHDKWAVIACDQFTSDHEYWNKASDIVGNTPSTLNIILPEIYLEDGDSEQRVININSKMNEYLGDDIFDIYPDSMIFVERTLPDGKIRYGIVGTVDLEAYDYNKGATSLIRATEGTVLDRIPPRVKIRKDAPIESPHIMVLIDDPLKTVIEPLKTADQKIVYDFELMLGGGHIRGKLIDKSAQTQIINALGNLCEGESDPLLFAMGDGNHSLATAKECYMTYRNPLNRYALVEIVNIHDDSLEFEPIYRVLFNADTADILSKMQGDGHKYRYITSDGDGEITLPKTSALPVGTLQNFIDDYIKANPQVKVDYIHGVDSVEKLAKEANTIGFVFDGMEKAELFPTVKQDGALPRKTFSMGEAVSKRYYMECRRIK